MIPSFVNQFVSMIKDTSLAFIVGVSELTHVATQINNRTIIYPTEIFFFIAVVYFIICYAFTSLSRWLERRLAWRRQEVPAGPEAIGASPSSGEIIRGNCTLSVIYLDD